MNKKDREALRLKYANRCAYCGNELQKTWHADHMNAVHRLTKNVGGVFVTRDTGLPCNEQDIIDGNYTQTPRKIVSAGMHKPENDCIENMMPSCPSCNHYKHSADLETFRMILTNTIRGLNNNSTQYKFARRYGLIIETNKPVAFYFETLNDNKQCENLKTEQL